MLVAKLYKIIAVQWGFIIKLYYDCSVIGYNLCPVALRLAKAKGHKKQ
jgi:hypothetical protein